MANIGKAGDLVSAINNLVSKHNVSNFYGRDFEFFGIRFEKKERAVGDVCECSRHNPDRVDDRDFPSYSSNEYASLPELDGTSAWRVRCVDGDWRKSFCDIWVVGWQDKELTFFNDTHCYLIAGNDNVTHDDCDTNEIVIKNAVVIAILF